MKYVRILCAVALVFALCSAFTMKDKEKAVYAFGVAASFNDSIVYYTDIQVLDSVELDKNGFLPKRDLYTYQLKNYLEYNLKKPDYTCLLPLQPLFPTFSCFHRNKSYKYSPASSDCTPDSS